MFHDSASDEDMYRLALRLAEPLLSTIQMNLLKFALSLRYYSPAIAMYAQVGLSTVPGLSISREMPQTFGQVLALEIKFFRL